MYKEKAIDSLILVVEFFNRPQETGRLYSVLIHLNHSIEMLLKSILLKHNYGIRSDDGYTIDISKCISVLHSGTQDDPSLNLLSDNEKLTLKEIAAHRNEAMHGNAVISEQLLYSYTRSGISIIDSLLGEEFEESLDDHLPNRVLPISGKPLKHLDIIYDEEVEKIQELLEQGSRESARARARAIEISNRIHEGEENPPTNAEMDDLLEKIESDDDFESIFPEVSNLQFDIKGRGPTIKLELTKSKGYPVHHVSDDEESAYAIGYREVNPFDRYSLGFKNLAKKIKEKYDGPKYLTQPRVWAILRKLDIHGNEEYHKKLTTPYHKKVDRYKPKSIERIVEAIDSGEVDPQTAWETHGY